MHKIRRYNVSGVLHQPLSCPLRALADVTYSLMRSQLEFRYLEDVARSPEPGSTGHIVLLSLFSIFAGDILEALSGSACSAAIPASEDGSVTPMVTW